MVVRVLGFLVLLMFGLLLGVGFFAVQDAEASASSLAVIMAAFGKTIDSANWAQHWRLSSMIMFLSGLLGSVAGIGMMARRRWSLLALAAASGMILAFEVAKLVTGFNRYAFEAFEPAEAIFLVLVAGASVLGYLRWTDQRRTSGRDT